MKRTVVIRDPTPESRSRGLKTRAVLTFACALAADGMQWLIPFLWPVFDGAMVVAILVLWGWRWEVLVVVIPELIPGLELAPTWTLFAAYLFVTGSRPAAPPSPSPRS